MVVAKMEMVVADTVVAVDCTVGEMMNTSNCWEALRMVSLAVDTQKILPALISWNRMSSVS